MLRQFLKQPLLVASLILLSFSVYFYLGAERLKRQFDQGQAALFEAGDTVLVNTVIDGNEVSVEGDGGKTTIVRLLGIKTFESSGNDFTSSRYAKLSMDHLQGRVVGSKAKVALGETKIDPRGRLLAYLDLEDTDADVNDVGAQLIARGLAVTFTKYPAPREKMYLAAEAEARQKKEGIWASPELAKEAVKKRALWDQYRAEQGEQ